GLRHAGADYPSRRGMASKGRNSLLSGSRPVGSTGGNRAAPFLEAPATDRSQARNRDTRRKDDDLFDHSFGRGSRRRSDLSGARVSGLRGCRSHGRRNARPPEAGGGKAIPIRFQRTRSRYYAANKNDCYQFAAKPDRRRIDLRGFTKDWRTRAKARP